MPLYKCFRFSDFLDEYWFWFGLTQLKLYKLYLSAFQMLSFTAISLVFITSCLSLEILYLRHECKYWMLWRLTLRSVELICSSKDVWGFINQRFVQHSILSLWMGVDAEGRFNIKIIFKRKKANNGCFFKPLSIL